MTFAILYYMKKKHIIHKELIATIIMSIILIAALYPIYANNGNNKKSTRTHTALLE